MGTGEFNAGGNPAMDWHPIQGGAEILLATSCHRNQRQNNLNFYEGDRDVHHQQNTNRLGFGP